MGRHKKQYTKRQIIEAINASKGIVSRVAQNLGCDWHTAQKNIMRFEETRQQLKGECECLLDLVESKAIERIKDGDGPMIRFYLATRGKKRGFTEAPAPENDTIDTSFNFKIVDTPPPKDKQ